MKEHHRPHGQGGFTLVEQIVVAAVLVVLACMAAPALGHLVARSQLQAAQSDLMAALQQARDLAMTTQQRAMLCPSRDGLACTDELHWEHGWLLGHYRSTKGDQLEGAPTLRDGGHDTLTILSTSGRRRIRFQANGSAGGSNAGFTLCRTGHAEGALAVTVNNTGRIYGSKANAEQADRCAAGG